MPARTLRQGQLTLQDGAGTPNTLIIPLMVGDLEWTVSKDHIAIMNRGVVAEFAEGLDKPIDLSFTITFEEYTAEAGQPPTPIDFLFQQGTASAFVSTEPCGPFAVNLIFIMTNPCSTGQDETLTFGDFVATTHTFSESGDFTTIAITGLVKGQSPVAVRS